MNETPRRGQVWHVAQCDTTATGVEMWSDRFAVIVTNNVLNETARFVNVIYLTSKRKTKSPTHIPAKVNNRNAVALCEQVFTVDKQRLSYKVDELDEETMNRIDQAILFTFAITNTKKPTTLFNKWLKAIEKYSINMQDNPNIETECSQSAQDISYKLLYEHEKATRLDAEKTLQRLTLLNRECGYATEENRLQSNG